MNNIQNLFSKEEVKEILGISDYILQSKIKRKILKPNKDGLFILDDLLCFDEFNKMFNSSWIEEHNVLPLKEYTTVELFAGAGGLSIGMEKAGFKHLLLNEIDKNACNTLKQNRPEWNVVCDNISNLSLIHLKNKVDLLTGGFPCQSFSYAGKRLGFEDIRGTMFFEYARILKEIQPKMFLIENVKGLLNHDNGKTLDVIIGILQDLGYTIIEKDIYKSIYYKVPQKRERLIIIGIRNDLSKNIKYKKPSYYNQILTVKDALKKGILYDNDVPDSVGISYSKNKKQIMDMISPGGYWKDLPIDLQKSYLGSAYNAKGGSTGVARRLSWNQPSLTLTCSPTQKQTERCHPDFTRPLTTREYARIQTFPDSWIFSGSTSSIYKQIGNAVPINLSLAIGKSLVSILNVI